MLLKNAILSFYAANCMAFDNTSESIFEIRWRKKSNDLLNTDSSLSSISLFKFFEDQDFDVVKDNILYYIFVIIVKNLIKKIDCSTCTDNLLENNFNEHNYNHKYNYSILLDVKNRGGLIKCSDAVIKIVRFVEHKLIDFTSSFNSISSPLTSKIIILTKKYVFNYNIFKNNQ